MTSARSLLLLLAVLLLSMVAMSTAFPLDLPVVRRAYYGEIEPVQRPMECAKDESQYIKCYLCGKQLSDNLIFDRCCEPRLHPEIDTFCELITGGPY